MSWRPGPSYWRCLDCDPTGRGGTFRGPTQMEVRESDTLLPCPECGSKRIMFVRDAVPVTA